MSLPAFFTALQQTGSLAYTPQVLKVKEAILEVYKQPDGNTGAQGHVVFEDYGIDTKTVKWCIENFASEGYIDLTTALCKKALNMFVKLSPPERLMALALLDEIVTINGDNKEDKVHDQKENKGMGGHHSANMNTDQWFTPPEIIKELGPFDLDPCTLPPQMRPWDTAKNHYTLLDDGLSQPWEGRVWLNPPYGNETQKWLEKLADHGNGIALIFARTETKMFHESVWPYCDSIFFLKGRITFYHPSGERSGDNCGAPSVLVAYGLENTTALALSKLNGHLLMNSKEYDLTDR